MPMMRWVLLVVVAIVWSTGARSPTTSQVSALERDVIVGPAMVRVQLDLTIANPMREEREHVLDLRVPDNAVVDRFGLWVQGGYLEGEIAPRALGRRL